MTFAQLLKKERTALGLTQVKMAKKLGITQGAYCKLENGEIKGGSGLNVFRRLWRMDEAGSFYGIFAFLNHNKIK